MNRRPLAGLARFFVTTLVLNLRSARALAYGYAVPILFLLAFGALFRADTPPLRQQLGQLVTITILGGACFGLPTALVAERERGVWRRYRLLPVSTASLVGATLFARLVIVGSAVALQLALARWLYGTPWPEHPGQALVACVAVGISFLGMGLLIAALADDVPAVQALGQCLFLPMIMVGGVGVPLAALPDWAQVLSGFMPGRYAVDVLHRSFSTAHGLRGAGFSFLALGVIGLAAGVAGATSFRWDATARAPRRWFGAGAATGAWLCIGLAAFVTGRLEPIAGTRAYAQLTDQQLEEIRYDDLPGDNELVSRLAPPFAPGACPPRVAQIAASLRTWPPATEGEIPDRVRNLVAVAAIADLGADVHEAEIARAIFDELDARFGHPQLRRALAWMVLHPNDGYIITAAPELDLRRARPSEKMVRERASIYAKKYLGRLTGRITAP